MYDPIDMIDDRSLSPDAVADRWLRVAVAVADTGSFSAAARRLGVGQPAISHAIKQLEAALGGPVFSRQPGGVTLTGHGRRLADGVREGLDLVDRSVRLFRTTDQGNRVELSVSTPLATYWLMPRLGDFRLLHPTVELRISTSDNDRLVGHDDADLWIPLGRGEWPGLERHTFQQERIYPVAAPDHPLAGPTTQLSQLAAADLLSHEERYEPRFDWTRWFTHFDMMSPSASTGPTFSDYSLVVRAAIAGQGVALGWHHIVKQLVQEGTLVRVGANEIITNHPFELLARPTTVRRPAIAALRDWLITTANNANAAGPDSHDPPD